MIKKIIALTLALVIAFPFSGCGGGDSSSNNNSSGGGSSSGSGSPAKTKTPSDAYETYQNLKTNAYNRISDQIGKHDELALSAGLALLPLVLVDLSLIPLTILGTEGGELALSFLGMQGITIDHKGDLYTITYTDSDGESMKLTCELDAETDSMQSSISGGASGESLIFEYVKNANGGGYASQYVTLNSGGGDYTLIKMYFDESNEVAISIGTVNEKPDSIFRKTGLTADFAKSGPSYFIFKDDSLTVFKDGETKTYQ